MFTIEAMDFATPALTTRPTNIQFAPSSAGTGIKAGDRQQAIHATRLSAPRGGLRFVTLPISHHTGHQLQHPRTVLLPDCPDPKLLHQNQLIPDRIPGQHGDRIATLKDLPGEGWAPTPGKQPMLQAHAIHSEEALVNHLLLKNAGVLVAEAPGTVAQNRRSVYQFTGRL